jgi:hypothetical protein
VTTLLRRGSHLLPASEASELRIGAGGAGLTVGQDRRGSPVAVAVFRPDRAVTGLLVGSAATHRLAAVRAYCLGARVVVRTAWPAPWEALSRHLGAPERRLRVLPPGTVDGGQPAGADRPQLVIVDVGAPAPGTPVHDPAGVGWQCLLAVSDRLVGWDTARIAGLDLFVFQQLDLTEAALVGKAVGLAAAAPWMARIGGDMVGVYGDRRLVWARLSATALERQLCGEPGAWSGR